MLRLELVKMIMALWALIAPGLPKMPIAERVAGAIADEVVAHGELAPVYGSHAEDAATMAYFAFRESSLAPRPGDCDPETGKCAAHGVWQLHGPCGEKSIEEQARCWYALFRATPCKEHPVAIVWGKCKGRVPTGDRARSTIEVGVLAGARERAERAYLWRVLERWD